MSLPSAVDVFIPRILPVIPTDAITVPDDKLSLIVGRMIPRPDAVPPSSITTSSAMAAVLLNAEVETVTGRGAGLSDEGLCRKRAAISRALSVNTPNAFDSLDVLMKVGGFDIAAMCGAFLGGALYHVPIIVDGFISMVAALTAARLCPAAQAYMLPSHLSAEPAARMIAKELDFHPILHGGLRLGEGTGAVALLPFLDMASAVYHRLMTYGDIGM